ncbi:hypothetical protein MPTK1_2g21620 [Marchantia polymorpha subsp. ruderalis]|uniref:Phospholipid/glycerol acyltransferase domain-containing protein n=1 Tax=Marchantia polymorpha TaxID=3197 RepID=A0A2R6X2N2_MARPO|nr:hypothetical protein MARPO_0040s0052 [Marchantia polymorpha]BBN03207.1 hypothetical protein Mp_2g21620 [Marchantia polymorpha subsp. ruderalis]|eukprot:PTQ40370.1 hypothetical protein MARPO_0040s0052 [Marchantia polymorpha]
MALLVSAHVSCLSVPALSSLKPDTVKAYIDGSSREFCPNGTSRDCRHTAKPTSELAFSTILRTNLKGSSTKTRCIRRKPHKSERDGAGAAQHTSYVGSNCRHFVSPEGDFAKRRVNRAIRGVATEAGQVEVEVLEKQMRSTPQEVVQESTYLDTAGKTKLISVQDYMEQVPDFLKNDNGPPRWFCSLDAKGYPKDAPLLLFIPGMDSMGLGLLLHQRKLARLFEVRCLHIPLQDRTSFVGLVEFVEKVVKEESAKRPGPIYLLGESFGGSMCLTIAARNPKLDIVLVLVNPATSFGSSQLQPLIPLLPIAPPEVFRLLPFALSFTMGDPVKMASASVDSTLPIWEKLPKLAHALTSLLPTLPTIADLMPRETLAWKIKLLSDGAKYANSRLHAVKADILLLVSGKDQMLPSVDEARRLKEILPQTKIRLFKDSGHTLLLEEGVEVASLIKATNTLRHSKKFDPIRDFRPPQQDEIELTRNTSIRTVRQIFSPIFLSATEDGRIRRGLPKLTEGKPLLFVGNHTFIGFDLGMIVDEFLKNKGILLRGLAHPVMSIENQDLQEPGGGDLFRLFGTVPVNGNNLYRLLSRGEAALLYPGGVREALKRKGEQYQLIWSERAEFVRTAVRHGATIIPFAAVGGDDIVEIVLDQDELLGVPFLGDYLRKSASAFPAARMNATGEVANETFVFPLAYPKIPPRMYFLFQQPITTEGMIDSINDRDAMNDLYLKVKDEVESGLDYLQQKRNADPYKEFGPRVLYEATNDSQAPTFDY